MPKVIPVASSIGDPSQRNSADNLGKMPKNLIIDLDDDTVIYSNREAIIQNQSRVSAQKDGG